MDAKKSRTADERRFTQMEGHLPVGNELLLIPTALRRFVAAPLPLAPNAKPRTPNAKRYTPSLGKNCVR
jgi:hypothetical protein